MLLALELGARSSELLPIDGSTPVVSGAEEELCTAQAIRHQMRVQNTRFDQSYPLYISALRLVETSENFEQIFPLRQLTPEGSHDRQPNPFNFPRFSSRVELLRVANEAVQSWWRASPALLCRAHRFSHYLPLSNVTEF